MKNLGERGALAAQNSTDQLRVYSRALRRLLLSREMRERFERTDTSTQVAAELGLSDEMAAELKRTLLEVGSAVPVDASGESDPAAKRSPIEDQAVEAGSSAQEFLDRSLEQLRTGSRVLMAMSLALFLVGIGFLLLAGIRSFTNPDSVATTAVVGGIGVVQIVALFYRKPLQDLGQAISNAQQAKIIVLSYMLGIGLVGKGLAGAATEQQQATLSKLTDEALERLERFTEAQAGGNEKAATTETAPHP